jgi:hypothetical protein
MKKKNQILKKGFLMLFLLTAFVSVQIFNPVQTMAQSIFADKPKSDPNDDEKLCFGDKAPLKNDKYCEFYRQYKDNETTNPPVAAQYRNKMLYNVREQLDKYYDDYKNGRKVKTRWFQTILDILGIGLAFTGTVAGGERVKTVIGAVSGSFQAGRNSINDRFQLLQQQILINKMNSNRLEKWTEIVDRMDENVTDFPWENARVLLQQYFIRGNFEDALDSLVDETGNEVTDAQEKLDRAVLGATKKGELENKTKNFNDYILPRLSKAKELEAKIKKTEKERDEAATDAIRTQKIAELDSLNNQKTNLLKNYQAIATAIVVSGDFPAIDEKFKKKFANSPNVLQKFNTLTANIKNNSLLSAEDYDQFYLFISGMVGDDEALNTNFLKILEANKLQ